MARKRHRTEEVIKKLREAEIALGQGHSLAEVCKKLVISRQTYHTLPGEVVHAGRERSVVPAGGRHAPVKVVPAG